MRIFLPLLCVLCLTSTQGFYEGSCPRQDPPPGALVLSPGSHLVLTCSGHVTVNGVKVRNGSNNHQVGGSLLINNLSTAGVPRKITTAVGDGGRKTRDAGTGESALAVQPTSAYQLEKDDGEADYEEEDEWEEGSRVTRGIKPRSPWKWTRRMTGKGSRDQGGSRFEERGSTLSLPSVGGSDSGQYTCYRRGVERFSVRVVVAEPPETPKLSCYKRSPSSKIRCEWKPQRPLTIIPKCSLIYTNSHPPSSFVRLPCSYSSRTSRCWCAMEHHEDERRVVHMAYLCVTSIAGNATSIPWHFTPMRILQPDPPSNISVRPQEGHETRLKVAWRPPTSWKAQDSDYYELIYELKYRPVKSSHTQEQKREVREKLHYMINDVLPGVEYVIQLRTKDEYDGLWSDWSVPVHASSWTDPSPSNDLTTPMFPDYGVEDGSGSGNGANDDFAVHPESLQVSPHVFWISGIFVLLAVVLAVYIFRHHDRFILKLQSLCVVTHGGESAQPSVPTVPEGQALVSFGPPAHDGAPPSDGEKGRENEEEHCMVERTEAMHFNNMSYFFVRPE